MVNYSFVISHAVGLEETSEKPAVLRQFNRKGWRVQTLSIQNAIDKREKKIFQGIIIAHPKVIFGLISRGIGRGRGGQGEMRKTGEERRLS